MNLPDDDATFVWKIITGLSGFISILLGYIWSRLTGNVKDHDMRLIALEKSFISRDEFNGAMESTRKE